MFLDVKENNTSWDIHEVLKASDFSTDMHQTLSTQILGRHNLGFQLR